jgi:hypothetical protein
MAFYIFYTVSWTLQQGGANQLAWQINFLCFLFQGVFIAQFLEVSLVHLLVTYSIRPQLRRIYHVLSGAAIRHITQERKVVARRVFAKDVAVKVARANDDMRNAIGGGGWSSDEGSQRDDDGNRDNNNASNINASKRGDKHNNDNGNGVTRDIDINTSKNSSSNNDSQTFDAHKYLSPACRLCRFNISRGNGRHFYSESGVKNFRFDAVHFHPRTRRLMNRPNHRKRLIVITITCHLLNFRTRGLKAIAADTGCGCAGMSKGVWKSGDVWCVMCDV